MARPCTICTHPNRREIDRLLVTGASTYRNIAKQFGVSISALTRHKDNHIPKLVQAAQEVAGVQAATQGDELLTELEALRKRTMEILFKAEKAGELRTALQAIREARETLKTQADLSLTREMEERLDELEAMLKLNESGGRSVSV